METAKQTLTTTWQEYTRSTDNLVRRFKTARVHSRYRQLLGPYSTFYTDTLFSNVVSLRGNTCGQVYFNKANFYKFYPLRSKSDAHTTLIPLLELTGLPSGVHSDRAPELINGQFSNLLRKYRIRQSTTEAKSPWQNRAEGEGVKPIKRLGLWLMERANAPARTWDFAYELAADILSLTCKPNVAFGMQTGYQAITNIRPDISQHASFSFYQWIWHWDEIKKQKQLGRWLGVAEGVGPIMTFWILPSSGIPIPRSSIIPVTTDEKNSDPVKERIQEFTLAINPKLCNDSKYAINSKQGANRINSTNTKTTKTNTASDLWDGDVESIPFEPTNEENAMEQLDEHIGQQIELSKDDSLMLVTVVSRKRDPSGKLIGSKNANPKLDSRVYNVQYPDGHYEQYSTNVLCEAINETLDVDGYAKSYIDEICGYKKDLKQAIATENGYTRSHNGRDVPIITTKGWDIKVRWIDGSTTWVPLSVFKNSQPLMLAEYARTMNIQNEPAFRWWVPHVLKKASRLISKMKVLHHKNSLKFGLEIPKSVKDATRLNTLNGSATAWV